MALNVKVRKTEQAKEAKIAIFGYPTHLTPHLLRTAANIRINLYLAKN